MSEIFVVTKQQKEMLLDFLAKVDKEIAPNGTPSKSAAGALGLTGDDVETSVSTYLSSSEIEKLFYLIHGFSKFRNDAFNFVATFCHNPKNHELLIKLGIINDISKEIMKLNSPVIIACISALADLANVPENRDLLRFNGCIKSLVTILYNPSMSGQQDIIIGIVASLCINTLDFAKELVESGALGVLTGILNDSLNSKLMEEDDNSEDSITVNCLWVLATACYSQISHAVLLREGTIDILIKVVERSHSVTYCDYSLSSLLQLSASEECRKAMIKSYCHTVLLQKASCGVPSIVRRSLQVLANLCVDEPSRKLISELSGALQTVIKLVDKISVPQVPDSDDTVQAPSDKFDMRSLLQGLKFFSNLIQSDVESKKFRESGGIAWLVRLIIRLQAMKLEPVVEQQIAHLAANVLIYGDNHSLWVEAGGLAPLKCMLDESKHMAIQKEAARALSNLFAYYDDVRIKGYESGIVSSLVDCLKRSAPLKNETAQLQLFLFRSLASLAFSYYKIGSLISGDVMDISADMVCGVTETDLKSDETSGVLLLYLNFLSSLCGNLNIDVNGEDVCDIAPSNAGLPDLRVQVATSPKIGIPWLMKLIQVNDRSIQLQTLKLLIQLATSWKTREIIKTGNIDVDGILCASLEGESQNIIKHIQQYIAKYSDILSFPYAVPEQAPKPQEQQQEQQQQQQEQLSSLMPRQNGTAVRRDRRVRHKALKLTPDQVEAISTGSESGEKSPTRIAVLKSFILTERKYVAVLSRTLWMYFKPLYGLPPNPPKGLISSSVLRVVFSPMEQLTNVCATFVDIIEHRACGNDLSIGDVLDEFSKKFCIYTEYADTVQRSLAALAESQMKNSGLNTFIENVDRNPRCKGKTLRDALELPMSHVDAYLTFLKEMNISTHELHPDSPHIRAALEAVSAQLVKIKKPETNQERIIRRIDARFKGLKESFAGKKGRKFVCETNAKLLQIGSKALEEEIDTTIFLFSDILVVAKLTQKKMCKLLDCIPLIEIIAGNADDSPTCFKIQRNSTGSSFQSGYTLSLPSAREQKLLLDAILEAQTALTVKK